MPTHATLNLFAVIGVFLAVLAPGPLWAQEPSTDAAKLAALEAELNKVLQENHALRAKAAKQALTPEEHLRTLRETFRAAKGSIHVRACQAERGKALINANGQFVGCAF